MNYAIERPGASSRCREYRQDHRVEDEAVQARSLREAVADAIGGFVGTIYFVVAQLLAFAGWIIVNSGKIPWIAPFNPLPYPLYHR